MEQKDNSATQQGQCPGDCRLCHTVQRAYCATQISFNTQKAVEALLASVTMLTEKMDTLIRCLWMKRENSFLFMVFLHSQQLI